LYQNKLTLVLTLSIHTFLGKHNDFELGSELIKRGLAIRDTNDIHFVPQIENMHIKAEK